MNSKEKLTEVQITSLQIVRRIICHPKSELIYAPLSHMYYVENGHYYIRFGDNAVTITNGKFSYYVWLPAKHTDEIRNLFYRILESRKNIIDKKYDQTTLHNLQAISESLTIETKN